MALSRFGGGCRTRRVFCGLSCPAYRQRPLCVPSKFCAYRQRSLCVPSEPCAYRKKTSCVSLKCCSKLCKNCRFGQKRPCLYRSQSMIADTEALLTTSAGLLRTCSIVKLAKHKQRCQRAGRAQDCRTPPVLIRCTSDIDRSQRPTGTCCAILPCLTTNMYVLSREYVCVILHTHHICHQN